MDPAILSVSGLRAGYGSHEVLHDVAFSCRPGEICGLIGPNGAGKTTLLRTLYGLMRPSAGRIRFDGQDINATTSVARLRLGIGYVPQERSVFQNLTVTENLELALTALPDRRSRGAAARRTEFMFALFPRLGERRRQLAGTMSGGEQRMVAIAIGLMSEPRVLMLDEPTTGLAPQVVHQLMNAIKRLNVDHGISTIIVEQNIISLLKIADVLHVLKDGVNASTYSADEFTRTQIWDSL